MLSLALVASLSMVQFKNFIIIIYAIIVLGASDFYSMDWKAGEVITVISRG